MLSEDCQKPGESKPPTCDYWPRLKADLQDPEFALEYLKNVIGPGDTPAEMRVFLKGAMEDVLRAWA